MSNPSARDDSPLAQEYHPLAAFLSYLVPGLGQIAQGRLVKGVLFFICVLTLFYYGMYLGSWNNVYVTPEKSNPWDLGEPLGNLYNRPQFAAQFFVGMAAWPALIQHFNYDAFAETGSLFGTYQRVPYEARSKDHSGKSPDPAQRRRDREEGMNDRDDIKRLKWNEALSDWNGKTLNEMQNEGDKTWDLGWVFTVIAGALNL